MSTVDDYNKMLTIIDENNLPTIKWGGFFTKLYKNAADKANHSIVVAKVCKPMILTAYAHFDGFALI